MARRTNQGSAGMAVEYLLFRTPLGWLLTAATSTGIFLLEFHGDDAPSDEVIRASVYRLYPGTRIQEAPPGSFLHGMRAAVDDFFEKGKPIPAFPLDMNAGTDFQRDVLEELCRIPFGQTRTYKDVAQRIGRPQASRAVGQACGNNPVAILIPCHRVVASDGGLGGYSAGLPVKQFLLDRERRQSNLGSARARPSG